MDNRKKKSVLNEDALTAALVYDIPDDDPRRLVRKLVQEGVNIESLPPFVLTLDYNSVAPSSFTKMQCNFKLYAYAAQNRDTIHAVHTVSTLLQSVDVVVCKDSISYEKVEKDDAPKVPIPNEIIQDGRAVIPSSLGLYSCSPQTELYSVAATALSYVTERTATGLDNVFKDSRKNMMMNMNKTIDAVSLRSIYETETYSSNLAREELFTAMTQDLKMANIIIDQLYAKLPYCHTDERVKSSYEKQKKRLNKERRKEGKSELTVQLKGNLPGCFIEKFTMGETPSLNVVLTIQHIAEQTIGGGDKKRGALTSGYIYAEMPAHLTKMVYVVREIKSLLNHFKLRVVKLPYNKRYTEAVIKVLVANGVYVVSEAGHGVLADDNSDYGHYRYTVVPALEIVSDPYSKPGFNAQGPIWDASKFEKEHGTFLYQASACRVTATTLSPSLCGLLEEGKEELGILPSLYPHKCRVWLVNRKVQKNFSVDCHIERFMTAIWARVKFPFTRRPYYASDDYNGFFVDDVKLLKVDRKITDNYRNFYVKKNCIVQVVPIVPNVYEVIEDKTLYDALPAEVAKIRVDHLMSFKDVNDRYQCISAIMAGEDYSEIRAYVELYPEYIEVRDAYLKYVKNSGDVVVKQRKVEVDSSNSSSSSSEEEDTFVTQFMNKVATVTGDAARKLEAEKRNKK